jgi:hypothetical protein
MNVWRIAALLSFLITWDIPANAQASPHLTIAVLEGEGTVNDFQENLDRQLVVQVRDEIGKPVSGATVTFSVPTSGPSGNFFGVATTRSVTSNAEGRASAGGFRSNSIEGPFQIQVTAVQGNRTGSASISENNASQVRNDLRILVLDGEGATNDVRLESGRPPVVQVRNQNGNPVPGAKVTFSLPDSGAGGTFFGVLKSMSFTTNGEGRATAGGFRSNSSEGTFQIQVTAVDGNHVGTVSITQTNTGPNPTDNSVAKPNKKFGKGKIIAAVTAGGIVAAILAKRGNDGSASKVPGTSITPGTVSVGTPR